MHVISPQAPDSVALYWDFENLHAALCEMRVEGSYSRQDNRFKVQDPLVNIEAVISRVAAYGPLAINRAYCNCSILGAIGMYSCTTQWN
jgi:hypothetical protein